MSENSFKINFYHFSTENLTKFITNISSHSIQITKKKEMTTQKDCFVLCD